MSLADDIKEIKDNQKKTKWQILKEHENDIMEMIRLNLSIKKQVELILKNKILEKIDDAEYRNILIKHFGYKVKSRTKKQTKQTTIEVVETKNEAPKKVATKINPGTSAKNILSQDIDLLNI